MVIGHDGYGVVIMPGVRICNGAVVGSNSVVTKDVPAHAIVAGAGAKVIGPRFPRRLRSPGSHLLVGLGPRHPYRTDAGVQGLAQLSGEVRAADTRECSYAAGRCSINLNHRSWWTVELPNVRCVRWCWRRYFQKGKRRRLNRARPTNGAGRGFARSNLAR